jgi:glycosyltransferase involved in cell wall biosynthesis
MKKKILIVTPGFFPLLGGMEEQCYLLGEAFSLKGYQVDLLTEQTKKEFLLQEKIGEINVIRLPVNRSTKTGLLSLAFRMAIFLYKNQSDYDFIIFRTLTLPGLVGGLLKFLKLLKIKTFITADTGGDNDEIVQLTKRKFAKIMIYLFSQHDFINSICEANFEHYKRLGFPNNKLTKIYNGIDISDYQKSKYPTSIKTFLFLAQLQKEKGLFELLEAFRKIDHQYHLFIAGDGPERQNMLNFISKHHLEKKVTYLGRIDRSQRRDFFAKGDSIVLPSYSEGFPLTICEAASYKKLIVATDVSDLRKIYGSQIILCEKRDSIDLLNKLLSASKNYQSKSLNYDSIILNFDINHIVEQLIKILT